MIGQTLGHYRILERLGEGGMGVVYKATDTKLGREVALKVLPDLFARDPERLARFQQEARLLAALNHPHIAAIHGLEEAVCEEPPGGASAPGESAQGVAAGGESAGERTGPVRFLVLELVPGETLAERIGRGALPVDEALAVCRQIAEALEAAHERGIIHRDLKPANVKVTPEGQVKLLDFGLGKAFGPREISPGASPGGGAAAASEAADPSQSPTLTAAATREGIILGTAAYMSPEQARGRPVDKRTDIWAFGCVLYECLTGKQTFAGETVSDTLVAILKQEPDWAALLDVVPQQVRDLLHRCLQKDAHRRLRDVGDARIEIEEVLSGRAETAGLPRPWAARRYGWALGCALAAALAAVLGIVLWGETRTSVPVSRRVARFTVTLPADTPRAWIDVPVVLSPDGAFFVYAGQRGATYQLFRRQIDQLEATPIPGTEGGYGAFFSPDGQWIGFSADGKLKKVPLAGGEPVVLCDAPSMLGASWRRNGAIVFSALWGGLKKVPDGGGTPELLTRLEPDRDALSHAWPDLLPDGSAVLFTLWKGRPWADSLIAVESLKTGERRILVEGGSFPRYVPTGHLVFMRGGSLLAAPFDPAGLRLTGPPVPVLDGVLVTLANGSAQFSFSDDGTLAYFASGRGAVDRKLVWVDRQGATRSLSEAQRLFAHPRLSPDGLRLALLIEEDPWFDIWVSDVARDTLTRLTYERRSSWSVWSPDGQWVAFGYSDAGPWNLYRKRGDGSGPAERLTRSEFLQVATSFSPDGKHLAFIDIRPDTGWDISILSLEGEPKQASFLRTRYNEGAAVFSPDGRWLAYISDESGQWEVYVQPYPAPGAKWQISSGGGWAPVWAPKGRELFYRSEDRMMVVSVSGGTTFSATKPKVLFEGKFEGGPFFWLPNYDVDSSGQKFVMVQSSETQTALRQFNVVLNWFEELKSRVPAGKN